MFVFILFFNIFIYKYYFSSLTQRSIIITEYNEIKNILE